MIKLSQTSKMPCKSWSIVARKHCPRGAMLSKIEGSVCSKCYACKGRYMFKNVQNFRQEQFDYWNLTPHNMWVDEMAYLIKKSGSGLFRWFDSGDIVDERMLKSILDVCYLTPDVKHWLPTHEINIIKSYFKHSDQIPKNLNIRISADFIGEPLKALGKFAGWNGITTSEVESDATGKHQCNPAMCGICRACWDRNVQTTIYHKH